MRKLLLFALTMAVSTGCPRPSDLSQTVTIEHEISPEPARIGPVVITLRLADSVAKAVTGAHITLEGDMSHPGMAPVFGEATEIAPGRYQARLTLEMPGDWVILLHVTMPGGRKLERQIDVRGVRTTGKLLHWLWLTLKLHPGVMLNARSIWRGADRQPGRARCDARRILRDRSPSG